MDFTISLVYQLNKVLSITSYVLCFCANLEHLSNKVLGPVTTKELSSARLLWIKTCQSQHYDREVANLQERSSKWVLLVWQLCLFLDSDGLLRCSGRIHNAPISKLAKFPYLLPANHEFTSMLHMLSSVMPVWTPQRLHYASYTGFLPLGSVWGRYWGDASLALKWLTSPTGYQIVRPP